MAEHTPGPWEHYDDWYVRSSKGKGALTTVCKPLSPQMSDDECRANARLIASAPAMRAAAIEVLEWYYRDGSVGGACEPMDALREAVGVSPEWLLRK